MTSLFLITRYNLIRIFNGLPKRYHIVDEPYYKYEIEEFKDEDRTKLLFIKLFLQDPEAMTHSLVKVRTEDRYEQLVAPSPPAYHKDKECEQLNRSYFNFDLPEGIKGFPDRARVCRDHFKEQLQDLSATYGVTYSREEYEQALHHLLPALKADAFLHAEFEKDGLSLDAMTIDSFNVIERRNSSSVTLDFMEKQIDELYERFRLEYKASAKAKGYKRPQAFRMEAMTVFRKKYCDLLIGLIIDFYVESYNPDLGFDREVLAALGFRPCSTCNGMEGVEGHSKEEVIDPIEECRRRMAEVFDLGTFAGTFGLMNTPDRPLRTIESIKQAPAGQYFGLHKFS